MSSIASKQKRHQKSKNKQREQAKRKAKSYKSLVLARRRQWDRTRRARERRERREHTQRIMRKFKFRVKVVRHFDRLREQGVSEKRAVALTLEKYRPVLAEKNIRSGADKSGSRITRLGAYRK